MQWVADQINYNQLPPEQKEILDARRNAEQRAFAAEKQASSYQTQHEQILTTQVQMALDSCLARPEVQTVAQAFDARMGKEGSFLAEVRRRGDYAWRTRNELVPPEKLVQELVSFLGPVAPQPAAAPEIPVAAAPPQGGRQGTTKAPTVIPNISGNHTSAVKPQVRSIADIKNRIKEMQG